MDILGAHGMLLVAPWEFLGSSWATLGSSRGRIGAPGCSLDAPWELCCVPWGRLGASWELLGFLGALLGWTWGGLSRLASISSVVLGALGGDMLQNVAVAQEWLVFLEKCCCGEASLLIKRMLFEGL